MKRIFLDANVLFTAAHNPEGKAALLIDPGMKGYWDLYTSVYAVEEAVRNIEIKYPESMTGLVRIIKHINLVRHYSDHTCPDGLNMKDRPIFQAAVECSATHLLTGDIKGFGRCMNQAEKTFNICIQTVADFDKDMFNV